MIYNPANPAVQLFDSINIPIFLYHMLIDQFGGHDTGNDDPFP